MWKVVIVALVLLAVLAGGAVAGLHRYDASRADVIAEGVTVAGVDVGGLEATEARRALDRAVTDSLERPLRLRYERRTFTIDPGLVDVRVDVDDLVRSAVAESRDGNFLERALRDLTGGRVDSEVPVQVSFSEEAVTRVVAGIRRSLDRPARDARSNASFAGITIRPSQTGVAVRAQALRRAIVSALVDMSARRTLEIPARILRPKVTTKELTARFKHFIAISRSRRELRFFVNRRLVKTYRVGIGQIGFETPTGVYEVETKAANPAWYVPNRPWAGDLAGKVVPADDPSNPIKARWMGFWEGAGIHGTADEASIGTAASHGCIRMTVPDVIDLYDRVPLRTPIYIG